MGYGEEGFVYNFLRRIVPARVNADECLAPYINFLDKPCFSFREKYCINMAIKVLINLQIYVRLYYIVSNANLYHHDAYK